MKSSPRSPQLEKVHVQLRRPNAARNKWINELKKKKPWVKINVENMKSVGKKQRKKVIMFEDW